MSGTPFVRGAFCPGGLMTGWPFVRTPKSHQREISGGECSPPPIFGLFQKPGGNSKFLGGIPPIPPLTEHCDLDNFLRI